MALGSQLLLAMNEVTGQEGFMTGGLEARRHLRLGLSALGILIAASSGARAAKDSVPDLKVKWRGAPEFSSADEKKFKFKVRGRRRNGLQQDRSGHADHLRARCFGDSAQACAAWCGRRRLLRLQIHPGS
jgi:hypothetical protein